MLGKLLVATANGGWNSCDLQGSKLRLITKRKIVTGKRVVKNGIRSQTHVFVYIFAKENSPKGLDQDRNLK